MINNINLSQIENQNKYKTYFIHIKKSQINDLEDINLIKNLLDEKFNENIDVNELKFVNNSDLMNISNKDIGKYLKSNKLSTCAECCLDIKQHCTFKELSCKHRFHIKCIDSKLKKDIYKKCTKCLSENITNNI